MAIKAIINNTEKEIEQIKNSDEQDIDYVYSRIGGTEVEGEPPISIKSIGENLANYHIYGNTVDGESVGDRTGNLFDRFSVHGKVPSVSNGELTNSLSGGATTDFIAIDNGDITLSKSYAAKSNMYIFLYAQDKSYIGYSRTATADTLILHGNSINGYQNAKYARIRVDVESSYMQTNIMLNTGSTAKPYEPYGYRVPVSVTNGTDTVTTNLYLPEQIKMVGDEAEYIDYAEQKQHRVRKNLLQNTATTKTINGVTFTVNDDGSIDCTRTNTQATGVSVLTITSEELSFTEDYILTGCPARGSNGSYFMRYIYDRDTGTSQQVFDYGSGVAIPKNKSGDIQIRFASGYNFDGTLTFRPMIRKADIEDDTYEPYIINTELDVTLPALPTIKGTNTLSVNTSIQPSNIYIKDNFDYKKVFTATRTIEGELPLNYRSIEDNDSTLKSYRIYGNTIDGESVGDRTGNLFDGSFIHRSVIGNTVGGDNPNRRAIVVDISNFNNGDKITFSRETGVGSSFQMYQITSPLEGGILFNDNVFTGDSNTLLVTITLDDISNYPYLMIFLNGALKPIVDETLLASKIMVNVGDTSLPYEPYGYKVPVTTERSVPHTATLQLHDCLPSNMQFDAPEALYYAENGLTAGTYNFTIQDGYDTSFGGGKTYQFTLANDVPAKGQLVFGWDYDTLASDAKITSYASSTSTTAIEQVGVTEGSGGTSLGTTDGNSTNVNHIHRVRYGSNNYKESAIRQFLNSSAVAGSVWTPQTKYDRPPSWNSNTAGFMKDIDSDFLAVLGASPKVVALNTVTDGGGSVTINNDKFFLLSRSEVYGGKENNINEGEPYPYYSNYSDLSTAGTGDDSNRIKYGSGTAQFWWLRSPYSAYGGNVRYVGTYGNVPTGYFANNSDGVAPACNIALDEDYKFNGQVLHVRDQISVTKGNQTLVFDVIGIDHDEVHFDKTTTNIYLPEPIKMVGDEAEYIDYGQQKQHRARKNLLRNTATSQTINGVEFIVNGDGSVTCNTDENGATSTAFFTINGNINYSGYLLSGCPKNGGVNSYLLRYQKTGTGYVEDYGNGATLPEYGGGYIVIRINAGYTCTNLTFYPMIRKADISDDTYEPYIENTDLDVTLPALPTLSGTNTLSVGTEVQPSNVYVKGKIKEIN